MDDGKTSLERLSVGFPLGSGIDDIGKLRSVMGTKESDGTMSGNSVGLKIYIFNVEIKKSYEIDKKSL